MFFARLPKSPPYKKTIASLHLLGFILVALCVLNACNDSHPQNHTDTKSTTKKTQEMQKTQESQYAQDKQEAQKTQNAPNTQNAQDSTANDFAKSPFVLFSSEIDSSLSSVFKSSLEILWHDTHKPILLFFGSPFCKPCKNISQHIAKSTPLQHTLKSHYQAYFINILSKESMQINLPFFAKTLAQKNATQNPQNQPSIQNQSSQNPAPFLTTQKNFSLALGVRATPTLMFLDAEGEEIFRFVGGISAEHLAIMLDFLKSPPTNKNQQQIALELHSIFKAQNPN
ncbi:thioredoxin family protein [Helicobacter sp. T3_23-1056]